MSLSIGSYSSRRRQFCALGLKDYLDGGILFSSRVKRSIPLKTTKTSNFGLRRKHRGRLLGAVGGLLLLSSGPSFGGSATWSSSPTSIFWQNPANWSPMTVPSSFSGTDVATFGATTVTTPTLDPSVDSIITGGIVFLANAPAYTITAGQGTVLQVFGAGITNNSGIAQNFVVSGNTPGSDGVLSISHGTVGSLVFITNEGSASSNLTAGITEFLNASSAGHVVIVNSATRGSGGSSGGTYFYDNSTAGNGVFINMGGAVSGAVSGFVSFEQSASAGNGTFINNGGAASGAYGGVIYLSGSSSGGNGVFINNGGTASGAAGSIMYFGTATNPTNVTLDNATLIANGGTGGGLGATIFIQGYFPTASTARIAVFGNGYVDISNVTNSSLVLGSIGSVTVGSIEGSGNVYLGANNLTTGNNNLSTTFSGVIQGGQSGGSGIGGSLTKIGSGVLTLRGVNSYTGGTLITGGLINFNSLANFGTGPITLNGGGLQWAPGTTTDVSGKLAPFGPNGATFDTNGNNVALAGPLSGPGSLIKAGAGILILSGTNTYSGGTLITGGLIRLNSLANLGSGSVTLNGGGLQWAPGMTTDISSRLGPIGPNGATFDTNGIDVAFAFPLSGSGGLTKTGAGSLTLSAANLYAGDTVVNAGTLYVDGSIASLNTIIQAGAILGGHGVLGGNLNNGGVVSPGNSPGTLTVNGNFTQASSGILLIQVAGLAPTQHDLLQVGGVARLGGALQLQRLNGFTFHLGDKLTFLSARGGVSGEFAAVANPFVTDTLIGVNVVYLSNSVELEGEQIPFESLPGLTPNQRAIADTLDASYLDPRNEKLISRLDNESPAKVLLDLDRISPEALTSIFQIAASETRAQTASLQRRLEELQAGSNGFSASGFSINGAAPGSSGPLGDPGLLQGPDGKSGKMALTPAPGNRWGVFVTGSGEWANVDDTNNSRGYDIINSGFTIGVDYKLTDHFAVGLACGYDHSSADLTLGSRVTVDAAKLTLYSTYFTGKGFYIDAAVQGGYDGYSTHRTALEGSANANPDGGEFSAIFGTGYDWKIRGITLGPTAYFGYSYFGLDRFGERGSLAPLDFSSQHQDSITSTFGAKASCDWKLGGIVVRPEIRMGWQHEYGDATFALDSQLASGAGPEFQVHGPATGRDSLLVGAGFAVQLNERASAYVYYDGELARTNYRANVVSGGFRLEF
jgi:outer membrane autotransporter protein